MGALPASLDMLTAPITNTAGETIGPLLPKTPVPPVGWGNLYTYTPVASAGTFTITNAGDGTTVTAP